VNDALSVVEFSFQSFKLPTVVVEEADGTRTPWIGATDACAILGYQNSHAALTRHVPDSDRIVLAVQTPKGPRNKGFINRGGLFRLILDSRTPSAERFKAWVVNEVLPAVQDKGAYIDPNATREQLVEIHAGLHRQLGYGAILKRDTDQLERELALRANVNNDDQTKAAIQDRLEIKKALERERALDAERSKLRKAGDAAPTFVAADLAARDRIWFRFDKGASWVHDKNDKPLRPVNDEEKEKFKIEA